MVGTMRIFGAKNSVLPILAASLLASGQSVLQNCPDLSDVRLASEILRQLGCDVRRDGAKIQVDSAHADGISIPEKLMCEMRSSIIFLGAMTAKNGRALLSAPGGCDLGPRPIDLHLAAFRKMGAEIKEDNGILDCKVNGRLRGAEIHFPFVSVGATENVLLAAVRAEGVTVIRGAAMEPVIGELCRLLGRMGADISGAGTPVIRVCGVKRLHDARVTVMPDRIVAGTYLLAAAGSGGRLTIENPPVGQLDALLGILRQLEMEVREEKGTLSVVGKPHFPALPFVQTAEYPGFPTDLQSQLLAVLLRRKFGKRA